MYSFSIWAGPKGDARSHYTLTRCSTPIRYLKLHFSGEKKKSKWPCAYMDRRGEEMRDIGLSPLLALWLEASF